MAYVFGFGEDATSILYAMRDWKLEDVKRMGGTPSCRALRPYNINNISCSQPDAYWICVVKRYDFQQDVCIVGLNEHTLVKHMDRNGATFAIIIVVNSKGGTEHLSFLA